MERLFETHQIRRSRECAPLWTLTTLDEGGLPRPEKVVVPSVWESHPLLRRYRGRGVYEQTLRLGGHVRIALGGVSFRARVFLDGALLASHYGAYTGFEAIALNQPEGEHTLRIEADNRFDADSALHIPNDYYAYGGINRPVIVEEVGDVYLVRCQVSTRQTAAGWTAQAEITVRNLSSRLFRGALRLQIAGREAEAEITVPGQGLSVCPLTLPCGEVDPWSPGHPALYPVTATLLENGAPVDDLIDRVGFREIRAEGKRLLLNGRPLRLLGFNRHEEYGSFGLSAPLEAMVQDVQLLRSLGANCVRTAHYPNDPRFLDLCDEAGLLVWEESHVRGFSEAQMRHPRFMEQLLQCTREMVEQHFNHPCIFVWGSLNECADDTAWGADCYRKIFALLRRMDPGRPVTAALLERPGGQVYDAPDLISINLYPQWYHDTPVREALDRKLREIARGGGAGKPVLVSEIGAGAIYGCHDPFGEAKWSEERQCAILKDQIASVLAHPDVCGLFLWQFADVRVAEEWAPSRPRTFNNKGVLDEYRRPKMAFRVVRELFRAAAREGGAG